MCELTDSHEPSVISSKTIPTRSVMLSAMSSKKSLHKPKGTLPLPLRSVQEDMPRDGVQKTQARDWHLVRLFITRSLACHIYWSSHTRYEAEAEVSPSLTSHLLMTKSRS